MSLLVVNISDMKISTNPEDVIVTYSLGSCLGVTAYDPKKRIGGLIHCLLARASTSPKRAQQNPYMFVNTGVAMMVRKMAMKGADIKRLEFKAAGGANMRNEDTFLTGQKNYEALLRLMERNEIKLKASDVGGSIPRTIFLHLDTGKVVMKSLGRIKEL